MEALSPPVRKNGSSEGAQLGEFLLARQFTKEEPLREVALQALTIASLALLEFLVTVPALAVPALVRFYGLFERIFTGLVLLWMLVGAVHLIRYNAPQRRGPGSSKSV